jgi:hypothetical protein
MNEKNDPDLQRRFSAWREHEFPQAPEFGPVWRRAQRRAEVQETSRRPRARLRLASAGVAVLAVVAVGLFTRDLSWRRPINATAEHADASSALTQDDPTGPQLLLWTAPTDFLLTSDNDDPVGQIASVVSALLRP